MPGARHQDGQNGQQLAASTPTAQMLRLQRLAGNRAVSRSLPPRPDPDPESDGPARHDAPPGKVDGQLMALMRHGRNIRMVRNSGPTGQPG